MPGKKKKRGGRVTAKGTQPEAKKPKRDSGVELPDRSVSQHGHLPDRVRHEQGRGARPITHNRGNR